MKNKRVICIGILFVIVCAVFFIYEKSNVFNNEHKLISENKDKSESNSSGGKSPEANSEEDSGGEIAFYDFDKKIILSKEREAGERVVPPQSVEIPYGYTFIGWDKPLASVSGPTRINAEFVDIRDKDNAFFIDSISGKKGDRITVKVCLGGRIDLCGIQMKILYEKDKLKFIKTSNEDTAVMVNCVQDGEVVFNLVANDNITGDVDLFDIEFKIIDNDVEFTELKFDSGQAVKFEGEKGDIVPTDYYSSNGKIYITN